MVAEIHLLISNQQGNQQVEPEKFRPAKPFWLPFAGFRNLRGSVRTFFGCGRNLFGRFRNLF
jgi:hypothetical protein